MMSGPPKETHILPRLSYRETLTCLPLAVTLEDQFLPVILLAALSTSFLNPLLQR